MTADGTITETPIGTTQKLNNTQATFKGISLNSTSQTLYADIGISDSNISLENGYRLGVYDNNKKSLKYTILYNTSEFILIEVPNANKIKGIQIVLEVQGYKLGTEEKQGSAQTFTFALKKENFTINDTLSLTGEEQQSVLFDLQTDIDLLELRQTKLQSEIDESQKVVDNAQSKIEERQENQATQTPEELEKSNEEIKQFQNSINSENKKISENQTTMITTAELIQSKKEKIEAYQAQNLG